MTNDEDLDNTNPSDADGSDECTFDLGASEQADVAETSAVTTKLVLAITSPTPRSTFTADASDGMAQVDFQVHVDVTDGPEDESEATIAFQSSSSKKQFPRVFKKMKIGRSGGFDSEVFSSRVSPETWTVWATVMFGGANSGTPKVTFTVAK